jgi:uncharacterized protein YbbK (DUF523 family)
VAASAIRIGVSACLLGRAVRYDGEHKRDGWVCDALAAAVDLVPVCPEVELGLGVPRDPIRLVGGAGARALRLVAPRTGRDLTAEMTGWADARVEALAGEHLSGFVLKAGSPSCGPAGVKGYAAAGAADPAALDGAGLFAAALRRRFPDAALRRRFPDMPIADEAHLTTPAARDAFLARVVHYREPRRA